MATLFTRVYYLSGRNVETESMSSSEAGEMVALAGCFLIHSPQPGFLGWHHGGVLVGPDLNRWIGSHISRPAAVVSLEHTGTIQRCDACFFAGLGLDLLQAPL
jgi:hypothetical protein